MYVCLCNALRERDIDDAIARGYQSTEAVYSALGVEPQCGSCVCDIELRIEALAVDRAA